MANENNWAGWREGSGRKKGDRQECLYIRISAEAMAKLDSLTKSRNRGKFINDLIMSI